MSNIVASFSIDTRDMPLVNENVNNFNFTLRNTLLLPGGKNYDMCLARGMMFYAWNNLELGLSPFDFEFAGNNYTLVSGNYSILTLEAKIKEKIEDGGGNPDDFEMRKDYPTGVIVITLLNGATFTPTSDPLAEMIGFDFNVLLPPGVNYGGNLPDFEGKNSRIFILNNLLKADATMINNRLDQILYEVKPPERPAYSLFNVIDTPEEFIWMRMSSNTIFSMNFSIVNQNNEPVNLNDTNINFWILIRESPTNIVEIEKGSDNVRP